MIASSEVCEVLLRHRQLEASAREAGGVLLGRRRGAHFELVHATYPFPTDRRTRTRFEREPYGHQEEAWLHWTSSGGEIDYVGEWHTHPEARPQPSALDCREWPRLPRTREPAVSMLVLIVGIASWYVAIARPDGTLVEATEVDESAD